MAEKEITYVVDDNYDAIIEEGQNTSTNFRRVSWGKSDKMGEPKFEIRKWYYNNGQERPLKGVTLSDSGVNELTCILAEYGFGDTKRILKSISGRDDFVDAAASYNVYNFPNVDHVRDDEESYYDPKKLIE